MPNVYFLKTPHGADPESLRMPIEKLLLSVIEAENISLCGEVPLKVHFGEKKSFIDYENAWAAAAATASPRRCRT